MFYAASDSLLPQIGQTAQLACFYTPAEQMHFRNMPHFECLILGSKFVSAVCLLVLQIGQDSTAGMVSRVGVIYLAVSLFGLMNAVIVVLNWNKEQPMYLRERNVSAYSAGNYSFAWGLAEVSASAMLKYGAVQSRSSQPVVRPSLDAQLNQVQAIMELIECARGVETGTAGV